MLRAITNGKRKWVKTLGWWKLKDILCGSIHSLYKLSHMDAFKHGAMPTSMRIECRCSSDFQPNVVNANPAWVRHIGSILPISYSHLTKKLNLWLYKHKAWLMSLTNISRHDSSVHIFVTFSPFDWLFIEFLRYLFHVLYLFFVSFS